MKKKKECKHEWVRMKDSIEEQAIHATEYWGFQCLKNATELQWDIGTQVYFQFNGEVCKGIVCRVNTFSVCQIKIIPFAEEDCRVWLPSIRLYTNVSYALKEAEYSNKLDKLKEVKK